MKLTHVASLAAFMLATVSLADIAAPPTTTTTKPTLAAIAKVTLMFHDRETSMDSNSQREQFVLEGKKVAWSYEYGGYHPDPKFKRKQNKKGTLKDLVELEAALASPELASSKEEALPGKPGPLEAHGGGRSKEATLTVERKGSAPIVIKLSGSGSGDPTPALSALYRVRDALNRPFEEP